MATNKVFKKVTVVKNVFCSPEEGYPLFFATSGGAKLYVDNMNKEDLRMKYIRVNIGPSLNAVYAKDCRELADFFAGLASVLEENS